MNSKLIDYVKRKKRNKKHSQDSISNNNNNWNNKMLIMHLILDISLQIHSEINPNAAEWNMTNVPPFDSLCPVFMTSLG